LGHEASGATRDDPEPEPRGDPRGGHLHARSRQNDRGSAEGARAPFGRGVTTGEDNDLMIDEDGGIGRRATPTHVRVGTVEPERLVPELLGEETLPGGAGDLGGE